MCVIYVTAQESIHRELLLYTKCLARCLWKCCSWMKKISVCFVLFFHQNICNWVVTDSHIIRNLIFPYLKDEDLFGSSVVSFLLAWTGAHRGARSSAFPIESNLPWWSMARCSLIPPGEEIQHILRFKLPSQSNMQIACIFLVVLLTTDSTHLVIVPICDSIGLNSSFLHLKQHPHSQDWLAVLSTQLQQHTVTNLGEKKHVNTENVQRRLFWIISADLYCFLIQSSFLPHLEPAAFCPAFSSAHHKPYAALAPWSGSCQQILASR